MYLYLILLFLGERKYRMLFLDRTSNRYSQLDNLKLLIPHYIDEEITRDLESHYKNIIQKSEELGINENIIFHDWVPYELMPAYYSLGKAILTIGNFIEAFGSNTILEALACGTYPITVKVGAIRTTIPDEILEKFDFDDLDLIEEKLVKILNKNESLDLLKLNEYILSA